MKLNLYVFIKLHKMLTNVWVEILLEHIMEEFVLKISFFNISVQAVCAATFVSVVFCWRCVNTYNVCKYSR